MEVLGQEGTIIKQSFKWSVRKKKSYIRKEVNLKLDDGLNGR